MFGGIFARKKFKLPKPMKRIISSIFLFITINLTAQNPYFEISKQMEIYNDVIKKLATNYIDDINIGDMMQKNTKRMLNGLDRFTTFYDEQGILNQKMRQEGHFGGLGINIRYKDSLILITDIFKDSPAAEKLKIGDAIIAIEDKKIADLSPKVASNLLKGAAGSEVKLLIKRNGQNMPVKVKRADIKLDAVTGTYLDGDIGYIRFVKFNQLAARQVKKALLDLKNQGAKKLIIDVRGNPGGLLNEVIKIVNFFIPKDKVVVTTKGRFEKYNKTYMTRNPSVDETIPIVILVNNRSASASEILSGSLQDYDRAVIIGDTTYGKGLVQRTYKLKYGTYMKQTISKYYIPSGRLIQKIDYWHRDKNGKPLLMRDNLPEKDYKTSNGRTVHNLGGVVPDIVMKTNVSESLIKDLINKGILFDFATWYYYTQPKPANIEDFKLTNKDFENLVQFMKDRKLFPKSDAEKMVLKAQKQALKEHQDDKVVKAYEQLKNQYKLQNINLLRKYKDYILSELSKDLINRYFQKEGLIQYNVTHDPVILKAKAILNDAGQYNKILDK